jgi:hypothetical protein
MCTAALYAADSSVLDIFPTHDGPTMTWYRFWVQLQVDSLPLELVNLVSEIGTTAPPNNHVRILSGSDTLKLFLKLAEARKPLYQFLFGFGELIPSAKETGHSDIEAGHKAES